MADHVLSVLCRTIATDVFTKTVNILDVADELTMTVPSSAVLDPSGVTLIGGFNWIFVSIVRRSDLAVPEMLNGRVTVVAPNKKEFQGKEIAIDLSTANSNRLQMRFTQLPFCGDGVYRVCLETKEGADWTTLSDFPFLVRAVVQGAQAEAMSKSPSTKESAKKHN